MRDPLIWLGAAAAIVVVAYGLTSFFWRPERNVDRTRLGHWFRSLIRLYETRATVEQRAGNEHQSRWSLEQAQRLRETLGTP